MMLEFSTQSKPGKFLGYLDPEAFTKSILHPPDFRHRGRSRIYRFRKQKVLRRLEIRIVRNMETCTGKYHGTV